MGQKKIQSLEKAIDILFAFAQERPYLTIEEISSIAGLPQSTCYRFINTMKDRGLIELDPNIGKYKLGVRLMKLESVIQASLDITKIALPFMQELNLISGETAQLMILSNDQAVCVERVESFGVLRVMPYKGSAIGLHAGASGKAIMAFLSNEEQDRIIKEKGLKKYSQNTITDPERLKIDLRKIRNLGYAISNQEIYTGVNAVAAPIFNHSNRARSSIGLAGPSERFSQKKIDQVVNQILTAAQKITDQLGGNSKEIIY